MDFSLPHFNMQDLTLFFPDSEIDSAAAGLPENKRNRLLVVDDEPDIRIILARCLKQWGYECAEAATGKEAIELLMAERVDLVLSDISMPGMDGFELLPKIRAIDPEVSVVIITGNHETEDVVAAMRSGADDYLLKPFASQELFRGVSRALEQTALRRRVREYQTNLEKMVTKRTSQVHRLCLNVIQSLITALEAKDPYTNGHSRRVAWLSLQLAKADALKPRDQELIQVAGIFHDLGKIGIRESILLKNGPLTKEEYDHIKTHPEIGVRILEPLRELGEILPMVRHHHERYDGRGYPAGIGGEDIPMGARILAVADAFDAMTSARAYRRALTFPEAISRLNHEAGAQLDPQLVGCFVALARDELLQKAIANPGWTSKPQEQWDCINSLHRFEQEVA